MKKNAANLDRQFVWHPFTQMQDWMKKDPIVIAEGHGAELVDDQGRTYIDANASIWTNLHGHAHPVLNRALADQASRIAHSSALGLANEPAAFLAEKLVQAAGSGKKSGSLNKVFFSDDGSTAMEVALKLSYESTRRAGRFTRPRFLSLEGAYHGDTVGAVSLGHIDLFHRAYAGLLFKSESVMAPYCYRCPFNRASPERADARVYRKCQWECVQLVRASFASAKKQKAPITALVLEPKMQGAAGMIPQPEGYGKKVDEIRREFGAQLILDEVMTGFGRVCREKLFAFQEEKIEPDLVALAKGLTGGYLPMAATLSTRAIFDSFLGAYEEFKTFFHGHSFTANQLGAAVANASLDLLSTPESRQARTSVQETLAECIPALWQLPVVGDVRQVGSVVGVELVKNWKTRQPFSLRERVGIRVCEEMARHGVLTRPIGNVVVLMPPYCATPLQIKKMVSVLAEAIQVISKKLAP